MRKEKQNTATLEIDVTSFVAALSNALKALYALFRAFVVTATVVYAIWLTKYPFESELIIYVLLGLCFSSIANGTCVDKTNVKKS